MVFDKNFLGYDEELWPLDDIDVHMPLRSLDASVVLISLDIERKRFELKELTEIGWAYLDMKEVKHVASGGVGGRCLAFSSQVPHFID